MDSKIISTIGPATEKEKSLKLILKKSSILRINGSHNTILWHEKISKKIKKINSDSVILFDIPGIKPRIKNTKKQFLKKNCNYLFYYDLKRVPLFLRKKFSMICLTKPFPKNISQQLFTISDGQYTFKIIQKTSSYVIAKPKNDFNLLPYKGVNFPDSLYDEDEQFRVINNFLKKTKKVSYDALGISFVQSDKILKTLKKKYPNKIIVSKIENSEGIKNIEKILNFSDVIMIDRGDLSAEIGSHNLFNSIIMIVEKAKSSGIPIIMATENFDSMIKNEQPTKSEIVAANFNILLNVDKLMLSDETATSINWLNTLNWTDNFLKISKKNNNLLMSNNNFNTNFNISSQNQLWNAIEKIQSLPFMIVTKTGKAIYQFKKFKNNEKLISFTDSDKVVKLCKFWNNIVCIKINKLGKKDTGKQVENLVRKFKKILFKKNKYIVAIFVLNPKKGSTANAIHFISKEMF
tara:strand:- start:943 stop:2331 length:1389 start_codon:yes stop_codon:yes gene_type:complete